MHWIRSNVLTSTQPGRDISFSFHCIQLFFNSSLAMPGAITKHLEMWQSSFSVLHNLRMSKKKEKSYVPVRIVLWLYQAWIHCSHHQYRGIHLTWSAYWQPAATFLLTCCPHFFLESSNVSGTAAAIIILSIHSRMHQMLGWTQGCSHLRTLINMCCIIPYTAG